MKYLLANILPIVCVSLATFLIIQDKDGWGWMIFLAIMTSHTFGGKSK